VADSTSSSPVVVVTGASRRAGIGYAIARRLLEEGASVLLHGFPERDAEHAWGADPGGMEGIVEELGGPSDRLRWTDADLGDPDAPRRLVESAVEAFGGVDGLVVNHAHGSNHSLRTVSAGELDRAWSVNARAAVLLVQAFAAAHEDDRGPGRVVLFTSGQHLGPMPGELPYAISKGAVHQMTRTLADELADREIAVNAVNPGPVDTGWPSGDLRERLRQAFPAGRWGQPDDIAAVVSWLLSPESAWVSGQVIDAEGGFRRR
jgi:3-oxoacyl-[acyl-carrier protein] reductase